MSYRGFNIETTDLDLFRSNMSNFQPPHSYSMELQYTGMPESAIKVYPDLIQLPDTTMQTMEYSPWGFPVQLPVHGQTGQLLASFILLDDWGVKHYLEEWMEHIQNISEPGQLSKAPSSYFQSIGQCNIMFYKNRKPTREYYSDEIYPISMTPVEFSASSSGYTTFTVLFYVRNLFSVGDFSTTVTVNATNRQTQ